MLMLELGHQPDSKIEASRVTSPKSINLKRVEAPDRRLASNP